jgi:predicted naringenin-chalcone synthase
MKRKVGNLMSSTIAFILHPFVEGNSESNQQIQLALILNRDRTLEVLKNGGLHD